LALKVEEATGGAVDAGAICPVIGQARGMAA
jgi:hypothetical protein